MRDTAYVYTMLLGVPKYRASLGQYFSEDKAMAMLLQLNADCAVLYYT